MFLPLRALKPLTPERAWLAWLTGIFGRAGGIFRKARCILCTGLSVISYIQRTRMVVETVMLHSIVGKLHRLGGLLLGLDLYKECIPRGGHLLRLQLLEEAKRKLQQSTVC